MTLLLHVWRTFPYAHWVVVLFIIKLVIDCWPSPKPEENGVVPERRAEETAIQANSPANATNTNPSRMAALANTVCYYLKEAGIVLLGIVGLPLLLVLMCIFGGDIVCAFLDRLPSSKRRKITSSQNLRKPRGA